MTKFKQVIEKHSEKLELYVPVVARVHGKTHPEFHEVHELYKKINEKIKIMEFEDLELNEQFKELRKITDNYKIPEDTCESYEAVYNMLSELDKAFNS